MVEQNAEVDAEGLPRIQNKEQLYDLVQAGELARIHTSDALRSTVPEDRALLRRSALDFLGILAAEHYAHFGRPLTVTSAVRTVQVQRSILRWNRGAAPAHSSAHLAGIAFDLQRRGLTRAEVKFLELRLLYYSAIGRVIVEEEQGRFPCIHVVVRREQ